MVTSDVDCVPALTLLGRLPNARSRVSAPLSESTTAVMVKVAELSPESNDSLPSVRPDTE